MSLNLSKTFGLIRPMTRSLLLGTSTLTRFAVNGVEATLANLEWKVFLETRGNQDFELARGAWCGDYNEASTFLDLLDSSSGYKEGK